MTPTDFITPAEADRRDEQLRREINADRAKAGRKVLRTLHVADHGVFETGADRCHVCGFVGLVLLVDTSDGECGEAAICFRCVRRALRQRGQKPAKGGAA